MPKKEHPKFGPVNERTFPAVKVDDGLRTALGDFKRRSLIHDYNLDHETLTLWRPCVDGQTQEEAFRGMAGGDRISYSRLIFRRAERKLREMDCGHGALHPRNIILRQGGAIELVDAIFNRVRIPPLSVPLADPWLWGPCVPEGWSLRAWDLVSLLRTAALLARDPAGWAKPIPGEEAVEICRNWAKGFIKDTQAGDDFIPVVDEAVALLSKILTAFVFPLDMELAALAARKGGDHMLRQRDEESLVDLAAKYGLGSDQLGQRLRVWMLLHGYREESELRLLAGELLKAGLYADKLVSARACAAAERTFTHYGVDPKEAADLVRQLLARAAWLDERWAAEQCRQFLAGELETASENLDEEAAEDLAADFAEELELPPDVARRLVDLELERRLLGLTR